MKRYPLLRTFSALSGCDEAEFRRTWVNRARAGLLTHGKFQLTLEGKVVADAVSGEYGAE
jgi:hypothetical protein